MISRPAITPDAMAFQSELDAVLAAPPPRLLRAAGLAAGFFLLCLVATAGLVRTDVMVIGAGTIQADAPLTVLQPMDRAVVRDLRARPGDRVTSGQLLATLDATFTQADLDTLHRQAAEAAALIARLDAELSPSPPAALPTNTLQAALYTRRAQEHRERLAGFDQAIAREAAAAALARQNIATLTSQLAIATQITALRAALLHTQSGSRLQYLQAEDARLQAAHALDEAAGALDAHTHTIQATQSDREAYQAQWHREALDALIAARADAARIADAQTKAARLHDLIELRAPQSGIVLEVAARGAGSIASAAEPLITILPANAPLVAEVSIPSADIGGIAEQDPADLKVDAFPYQQHGLLHGTVRSIGEQSIHPTPSAAMHLVRIPIAPNTLHALIPGMTLTAEIHAGTRNLLAYFLTPITRGLGESFREP